MPHKLSLNDAQQYFLQIMLNSGVIDQINFKKIFCKVMHKFQIDYKESEIKEQYVTFLREINECIKHFNMEIKAGNCEITGLSYYCMIRLCDSNSIGKLSTLYSSTELRIFRRVLELIIESDCGYVDYNSIVNEVYNMFEELAADSASTQSQIVKNPTNKDVRCAIEKFIQDNWLTEVIDQPNMITLHGRGLIELSQYIKQTFESDLINHCFLCKLIVLSYFDCKKCSTKMHKYCAKKLFKNTKDCPSCKSTISNDEINTLLETMSSAKFTYASSQFQSP